MQEEIQRFVEQVRDVYRDLVTNRIVRGRALFAQFEAAAVAGCREGSERNLTERVNELAVAKLLAEDPYIVGPIEYEPPRLLPNGRRIDFVAARGEESIYVEVKTVHPRAADSEEAWQNYLRRREHHPANVHFTVEQEWMGAAIYGNAFASRSHFLGHALDFEKRLAMAKAIRNGPGILVFCGNGFTWRRSDLEDFADYYHAGAHRQDDPFAVMEAHHIERQAIRIVRNIDHFACLTRPVEQAELTGFAFPVPGPRIFGPLATGLVGN
jgi:hypothetical protein